MSKDYRQAAPRAKGRGGGLLVGIFIGFMLGMVMAAAVAIYVFKVPIPYLHGVKPTEHAAPAAPGLKATPSADNAGKPRFDFYRILPGQEQTVTEQQIKQEEKTAAKTGTPSNDKYFLQAGSFQDPAQADNMKARLALLGLEASVEPTDLPDKGVRYRVRLGPYTSLDAINSVRSQLAQDGVNVSLVRVRDPGGK